MAGSAGLWLIAVTTALRSTGAISGAPAANWEIALALRALQHCTQDAQRALASRLNLGPTDVAALDHLIRSETPLGPVELGDRLGIRSASATVLVDRLEQAGHVVREPHPHDRRRRVVSTTEHARTEVLDALQPLIGPVLELARTLTDDQAQVVLLFLRQAAEIHARYARDGQAQESTEDARDWPGFG